ncbi:uncharacterized protein SCHCODRAFT_02502136 [Schizophyllum commune H4-8]|nr:uncharacterized protein SCHCODRAFT_02502136 [Schizophyllum commune H4-8]KAI5891885.1 hypothetical protein SCHCODRAFT_02502136 [Schizophyllum commune H4-8]
MLSWANDIVTLRYAFGRVERIDAATHSPTEKEENMQQYLKVIKRVLRKRPLHILLRAPHDIQLETKASPSASASASIIIEAIIVLKSLHKVEIDSLSSLWTFDDSVWTHAVRWIHYLFPIRDFSDYLPWADSTSESATHAIFGVLDSITRLPELTALDVLTANDGHVLNLLFALWIRWPSRFPNNSCTHMNCHNAFYSVWRCFAPFLDEDVILAPIRRMTGARPKRLSRLCGAHLNMIAAMSDTGREFIPEQLELMAALTRGGRSALSRSFMAALVKALNANAPHSHNAWGTSLHVLHHLCSRSDHDLLSATKRGLLPLLLHARRVCDECSRRRPDSYGHCQDIDVTGLLLMLIGDSLSVRRAVQGLHEARRLYATRMPDMPLREDEQALLTLCEQRYSLLQLADREWPQIAVCSNPEVRPALVVLEGMTTLPSAQLSEEPLCALALAERSSSARSSASGLTGTTASTALHVPVNSFPPTVAHPSTTTPLRAKDAHYLAVIARAYIEGHYMDIIKRFGITTNAYYYLRVDISLLRMRENLLSVSPGPDAPAGSDPCRSPTMAVHILHMRGNVMETRVAWLTPRTAARRVPKEVFPRVMDISYDPPPALCG